MQNSRSNNSSPIISSSKRVSTPKSPLPFITPRKEISFINSTRLTPNNSPRYSVSEMPSPRITKLKPNMFRNGPLLASSKFNVNLGTYTDARSPGLASRIVQYNNEYKETIHTHQSKYGSPGLFPVVHFFKKELPVLSPKHRVTVKLAIPDHDMYNGNIDNNLLPDDPQASRRDTSEQDSGTRSVLDALKEISRKQMNGTVIHDRWDCNSEKRIKKRMEFNLNEYSKRTREESPSPMETSPVSQPTKRLCVIDPVFASNTSSLYYSEKGTKRKAVIEPKIVEEQPVARERKQIKLTTVETQTDKPIVLVEDAEVQVQEKKKEETPEKPEAVKKTAPASYSPVFSEGLHEVQKKNKLSRMLGAVTGDEPKLIPLTVESNSKLVSILSPQNKSKQNHSKHVHFNLEVKTSTASTDADSQPVEIEAIDDTKTETTPTTPITQSSKTDLKTTTEAESVSPNTSATAMFNFGSNSSNSAISPAAATTTTQETGGGFKYDLSSSKTASPIITFGLPKEQSSAVTSTSTTPTFSFGAGKPIAEVAPGIPKGNNDSFAMNKSPPPFSLNTNANNTSLPKIGDSAPNGISNMFQTPPKSTNLPSIPNFNFPTTPTTTKSANQPLQFNSPTPASQPSGFQIKPTFGAPASTQATSANFFASPAYSKTTTAAMFNSGTNTSSAFTTPVTTAMFAAKPVAASAPNSMFGPGGFGNPSSTAANTTAPTFSNGQTKLTFGAPNVTVTTSSGIGASFNFSSAPVTTSAASFSSPSKPTFGAAGSTTGTFANATFGNTNAPSSFGNGAFGTSKAPSFGTGAPPAFGTPGGFSTTTMATTTAFGVPVVTSTTFGAPGGTMFGPASNTAPAFGAPNSSNTPGFGAPNTTSAPPAFGAPNTASAPVAFGAPNTTSAPPAFGASTTSAPPAFGVANTTSAPLTFGATTNASTFGAPTPSFGASTTSAPPPFGATTTTAASMFGATTNQPSMFGAPTTTATPAFGTAAQSAFSAPNPGFGSGSQFPATTTTASSSVFSFGGATSAQPATFGKPAVTTTAGTFVFNSSTATPSLALNNTPNFGTNTGNNNSFGNANATFGAPAQGGGFGTSTTQSFGSGNAPSFGAATTTQSSVFGTNTQTTAFGAKNVQSPFGSTSTPAFGTAGSAPFGNTQAPTPAFGAPATTNAFGTNPPSFGTNTSFGTNNNFASDSFGTPAGGDFKAPNTNSFGTNNNPASPFNATPQTNFGGNSFGNANANGPPGQQGVFSFGAATTNPVASPPKAGVFSFGAPEPPKAGGFNFSGSTTNNVPNFSNTGFNAPAPTYQPQFNAPNTGMFSIGSGSTTATSKPRTQLRAKRRT